MFKIFKWNEDERNPSEKWMMVDNAWSNENSR